MTAPLIVERLLLLRLTASGNTGLPTMRLGVGICLLLGASTPWSATAQSLEDAALTGVDQVFWEVMQTILDEQCAQPGEENAAQNPRVCACTARRLLNHYDNIWELMAAELSGEYFTRFAKEWDGCIALELAGELDDSVTGWRRRYEIVDETAASRAHLMYALSGAHLRTLVPGDSLYDDDGTRGVLVAQVEPGSSAEPYWEIRPVAITKVNDKPVTSVSEFERAIEEVSEGVIFLELIYSGGYGGGMGFPPRR